MSWNNNGGEYMIPSGWAMPWCDDVHGNHRPYDVHSVHPLPEGMTEYVSKSGNTTFRYDCIPFDVVYWLPGTYILPMGLAGPLTFNVPNEGTGTRDASVKVLKAIHAFLKEYEAN